MAGNRLSGRRPGFRHSEETRRKIAAAQRGKPKSKEHVQKISRALTGRRIPPGVRQRISEARLLYLMKTGTSRLEALADQIIEDSGGSGILDEVSSLGLKKWWEREKNRLSEKFESLRTCGYRETWKAS